MYDEFFHLSDLPFRLSPDHRFFYCSDVHERAIAHLKFGLDQEEGFILITGEVGAGKTTVIEHLLSTLSGRRYVAAHIVTTNLDQDNLVRMIAASFGVSHEGVSKASVIKNLERFIADCMRQGRRCLLFVDEAQNLSIAALEELRMLSNLQVNGRPALQSFLIGQPQFRKTLALPDLAQLRQRVIASYHLGPLSIEETAQYIRHRLSLVDWKEDPAFLPAALSAIYKYSEGIPRRINTLCTRTLLFAYLEEEHQVTKEVIDSVAAELEAEMGQVLDFGDNQEIAVSDAGKSSVRESVQPQEEQGGTNGYSKDTSDSEPLQKPSEVVVPVATQATEHETFNATLMNEPAPHISEDRPPPSDLSREVSIKPVEEPVEIIDLTLRGDELDEEDLIGMSSEAHDRLMRRALHTVINYLGGSRRAS